MSLSDVEYNLRFKDFSDFHITDNQIRTIRTNINDLYHIFKDIFDRPRNYTKPYGSVTDYKIKKQRLYERPGDFYSFLADNISCHIHRRVDNTYSVAITGLSFKDDFLKAFIEPDKFVSATEKEFSGGFFYYGHFKRTEFNECVQLYYRICAACACHYFGLKLDPIIKQMEFIF